MLVKESMSGPCYACIGAVSAERGLIFYDLRPKSIKSSDFCLFLRQLKSRCVKSPVILLDNCTVHKAKIVKELCIELGIKVIFNVPYAPQFNGIEHVWAMAKSKFRAEYITDMV